MTKRYNYRLPPLNAVRVFEAAARCMSFTAAAQELNVTPSAVSHQVRFLEEFLDLKLFTRNHKVISLTEEGITYLNALTSAFDIIGTTTYQLQNSAKKDTLSVRLSLPTFAMKWLIPRLHRFQAEYPQIDVRLTTSLEPVNFAREPVDVFLSRTHARAAGLKGDPILDEYLVAVCSPRLLSSLDAPRGFSHLTNRTRIWADSRPEAWPKWCAATGLRRETSGPSLHFEHYYLALQATIAGLGVTVAPRCLVQDELHNGTLIMLSDHEVPTDDAYYMVYQEERPKLTKIKAFRGWLLRETSASNALSR